MKTLAQWPGDRMLDRTAGLPREPNLFRLAIFQPFSVN